MHLNVGLYFRLVMGDSLAFSPASICLAGGCLKFLGPKTIDGLKNVLEYHFLMNADVESQRLDAELP